MRARLRTHVFTLLLCFLICQALRIVTNREAIITRNSSDVINPWGTSTNEASSGLDFSTTFHPDWLQTLKDHMVTMGSRQQFESIDSASPGWFERHPPKTKLFSNRTLTAELDYLKKVRSPLNDHDLEAGLFPADPPAGFIASVAAGRLMVLKSQRASAELLRYEGSTHGEYQSFEAHGFKPWLTSEFMYGKTSANFAVVSLPGAKNWKYSQTMYICAKFGIGFAAVWDANWEETWLHYWKRNVEFMLSKSMPVIVLTSSKGLVGKTQTLEVTVLETDYGLKPCSGNFRRGSQVRQPSGCYHTMSIDMFIMVMTPLMEVISDIRFLGKLDVPSGWAKVDELAKLHSRARRGAPNAFQYIDPFGYNIWHRAARRGAPLHTLSVLYELNREGLDLPAKGADRAVYGITPLFLAIKYGHTSTVAALLSLGADANSQFKGLNPLQWAMVCLNDSQIPHDDKIRLTELIDATSILDPWRGSQGSLPNSSLPQPSRQSHVDMRGVKRRADETSR